MVHAACLWRRTACKHNSCGQQLHGMPINAQLACDAAGPFSALPPAHWHQAGRQQSQLLERPGTDIRRRWDQMCR